MSHVRIFCRDCRDDRDRPLKHDSSCDECTDSFISRHLAVFPEHRVEVTRQVEDEGFVWKRPGWMGAA